MATAVQTMTPEDQAFIDAWQNQTAGKYAKWGTTLPKLFTYADKLKNIKSFYTDASKEYKPLAIKLGVEWLKANNPGVVDSNGDAFSTDFYKGIISGDEKTRTANSTALNTAKTKIATESAKLANPKATKEELATIVADIVNGSSTKPYNPATLTKAVSSTPSASLYKAGSMSADKLKSTYGSILDPDTGKALFSDDYLKKVASATTASGVQGFNDTLSKVASKVLASQTGSNYLVQSDADKADALTNLLKNPDTLASGTNSLYNKSTEPKTGINGLLPVGSFKDDKGNFVYNGGEIQPKDMSGFVQTYNNQGVANRGAYVAPTFNPDTKMYESKSTSPYANALTSLLGSTKNPFASDYKSSLAQPVAMTSTQLASLNKPFKENTTARDIINLQNSAGLRTGNELTKDSSLSKNLLGLYQTNPDGSAINSPWVADTDQMKIPTTTKPDIDTSTELVQLDPGGLLGGSTVVDPNLADNQDTAAGIDTLTGGTQYTDMNYITPAMRQQIAADPTILQRRPDLQGAMEWSIKQDARFWPILSESQKVYTPSSTDAVGIDTLSGKPNYTANDLQLMQAMGWTPEQLKANNEQFAIEQAKEADAAASSKRISNIIDSWKTPEDRWNWFAENPNDPYTKIISQDILDGKKPVDYIAPVTSPVVTSPVVTGNDSIKAVTGNDSIKAVTGNDSIKAVTGNDSTLTPQVTLTKQLTPEEIAAQENVGVQDYTGNYAEQAGLVALANQQAADGGPSSLAPSNNITSGPQQVTLAPDTVVQSPSPLSSNISSAQTVALPPSGPQPISPSNGGPSSYPQVTVNPTPAQNAGIVGTIDPATLSVANMNSNAGGLPSLMGYLSSLPR